MKPTGVRCCLCGRVSNERTGEPILTSYVSIVGADVCVACKAKSQEATLKAWREERNRIRREE